MISVRPLALPASEHRVLRLRVHQLGLLDDETPFLDSSPASCRPS
jgi:hypothetical protein